jgi:Chaperone of endosialidase
MKTKLNIICAAFTIACFALLPIAQAVVPAPDGGYPGGNTAEGQNALFSLTSGGYNTALGYFSLRSDAAGSFNTSVGAGTLLLNTGDSNTATGAAALLSNTTGATNTATGSQALLSNIDGGGNTANGYAALANLTTGNGNTALGVGAGFNVTDAFNVICIRAAGANVNNSCFISNINGVNEGGTISAVYINSNGQLGTQAPPSARRFKKEVKSMDQTSEAILGLRPVTFHYKSDTEGVAQFGLVAEEVAQANPDLVVRDENGEIYTVRYEAVNAMLLNEFLKQHCKVEEQERKISEQSSKTQEQETTIAQLKASVGQQNKDFQATVARQEKEIEALSASLKEQAAQIQKVSAQIETNRPLPQTVLNNH